MTTQEDLDAIRVEITQTENHLSGLRERADLMMIELFGASGPVGELTAELLILSKELDDTLNTPNIQQRNRQGITLHGKMDRVRVSMDKLESQGADVSAVRDVLANISRRLLVEIFGIDPDKTS